MEAVERLRESLPEAAKDLQLNLGTVLQGGSLDDAQRWGVALACAFTTGEPTLIAAVRDGASAFVGDAVLEDARAAAALMAMNNVFYRFRHFVGKPAYAQKPARLRMNRLGQPRTDKTTFELYCLAASAINGCEVCVKSHEHEVVGGGLSEDQVHDAVRIAATIRGVAVALATR